MATTPTAATTVIPPGHTLVQVFLNEAKDETGFSMGIVRGWRAGDPLRLAVSYTRPEADARLLAEDAFELCNVGARDEDDTGFVVEQAYRLDGNRSLSVGDVVRVGDTFLACDPSNWTVIDHAASITILAPDWEPTMPVPTATVPTATVPPDALTIRRSRNGSWDGSASLAILHLARDITTDGPTDVAVIITEPGGETVLTGSLSPVADTDALIIGGRPVDVDDIAAIAFL